MNGDDIERSIRRSIHEMSPDMLDALIGELGFETQVPGASGGVAKPTQSQNRSRQVRRWLRVGLSAAAVLVLAIGILSIAAPNRQTFAVIGLDVNPSIEISVDDEERVLHADALNAEAGAILEDLELQGTSLNTACHAVVGSMLVKGYLTSDNNSILVSVRSSNDLKGKEIERRLSEDLNAFMENSQVAVAILGQYVEDSDELGAFAKEHGVSLGKAWLIKKLLAADKANGDESSLVKLSTQELILLAQERHVESETSIGASDTSSFISKDEAVALALHDAGVSKKDATGIQVEFDCEDGALVYEVTFSTLDSRYEYLVDARSGAVVSNEVEPLIPSGPWVRDTESGQLPVSSHDDDDDDGDDGDFDDDAGVVETDDTNWDDDDDGDDDRDGDDGDDVESSERNDDDSHDDD